MPKNMVLCCGLAADELVVSRGQAGQLSTDGLVVSPTLCTMSTICTRLIRIFSDRLSTLFSSNLSLLFARFSPLSTGPINITTKYISNIGVAS